MWDSSRMRAPIHAEQHPAQLDIRRLSDERFSHPEEPLWATLARLGWLPPSTAELLRNDIQKLKPATATALDVEVGQKILLETEGLRVVRKEQSYEFFIFTLEDGSVVRRHRMDTVWIPRGQ